MPTIGLAVFGFLTLLLVWLAAAFLLAPYRAIKIPDLPLLFGLIRYATWDPSEAIIVQRRGRVSSVRGLERQGGSMFYFPIVGDKIVARVGLDLQSFEWKEELLTREGLLCKLELDVWWKIGELDAFLSSAGGSKHLDQESAKVAYLNSIEARLMSLTEEVARKIVAQAALLEILTNIKPTYLNVHLDKEEPHPGIVDISTNLTASIRSALAPEASKYGVEIERVVIQSVRFDTSIEHEIRDVWIAHIKVVRSEQDAKARRVAGLIDLDVLSKEIELLGGQTVSTREIVKHLPDSPSMSMIDLMKTVVQAAHQAVANGLGNTTGTAGAGDVKRIDSK